MKRALPLLVLLIYFSKVCLGQSPTKFPCNSALRFTRQYGGSTTASYLSAATFDSGTVTITNPGTVPYNLNASFFYNGYIWAQQWSASSFTLLKIGSNQSSGNNVSTALTVANMPTSNLNNAAVTVDGTVYMLNNFTLYTFSVASGTPTAATTKTITHPSNMGTSSATWGDIAIDPTTGRVYAWFHTSGNAYTGLYEIVNISSSTPSLVKVGTTYQAITLGTLFFTDRGQLFGYGSTTLGGNQDRLYAIDKATGNYLQYGAPDLAVSQSDGCNCGFRLSLEKSASAPIINLRRCSIDTFYYNYRINNTTAGAFTGIGLSDTLDYRLSFATSATALQTTLQGLYGSGVAVSFSNYNGGTNNILTVTGMNVASTIGTTPSLVTVPIRISAQQFSGPTVISQQAYLTGVPTDLAGPYEPSDNPVTYQPDDNTEITVNISGSSCLPPIADNFTNTSMPQGYPATAIPAPIGSDADGSLASFRIQTIPASTEGVLSYCPNAPGACTDAQYVSITSGMLPLSLTPAQVTTMRFDPVTTFSGLTSFTFTVTDNDNNESNTAIYRLPVITVPPVSNNIMENSMANSNGATAIRPLSSADADGITNQSYTLLTYPSSTQGVLSYCGQTNGTCTSGQFVNVTANNTTLSIAQAATLRFDPASGYTGNVSFNYNVTDLSGNISKTAVYTIPVTASATSQRPPLADNVYAQSLNNTLPATSIPQLRASDLDGYVTGYTITSLPAAASGTLYLANPTPVAVTVNQNIALADVGKLQFDPLPTYIGDASFTYSAVDNSSLQSNIATYYLNIVNQVPTATNMTKVFAYGIPSSILPAIGGTDKDGSITGFTITSLPSSGTLQLCNPSCTTLSANSSIAIADIANLKYTPAANSYGIFSFTYTATDNNGNVSLPAQYNIVVSNVPPVAQDVNNTTLANTAGATSISSLSATDADGTISYYTIRSLPVPASGVLYLNSTALSAGSTLTGAQISQLQFDPANLYTGVASFSYTATDNSGNLSNLATFSIPVSGIGNLPPIANTIAVNAVSIAAGPTNIAPLSGSDPEGTTLTYRLESVPAAYRGTLTYCATAPSSCSSASMTAATAGLTLTAAQAASLQFTPNINYSGPYTFSYTSMDADSNRSNLANYYIPIYALPPTAAPVVSSVLYNTNNMTAIPVLNGSDADGSVVQYVIQTLPAANQGILYLCNNINCTAPVAVTTGQVIPAANAGLLSFDPAETYLGDVVFNYLAIDNNQQNSNSATYTIPVRGLAPSTQDVLAPKMNNSLGSTSIPGLNGGTNGGSSIAYYVINSVPPASQGILYLCNPSCTAVVNGQQVDTADVAKFKFAPNSAYTGDAIFNYTAYNAAGLGSNTAAFIIPTGNVQALPLSGLILNGQLAGNKAKLNWEALNEQHMLSFVLERSTDGLHFEDRASRNAVGTGDNYYYADDQLNDLLQGTTVVYYRVKSWDFQGRNYFSNVIALNVSTIRTLEAGTISVFPNPASNVLNINYTGSGKLFITDLAGKSIASFTLPDNSQATTIDVSRLSSGLYLYRYIDENAKEKNGKLIIER